MNFKFAMLAWNYFPLVLILPWKFGGPDSQLGLRVESCGPVMHLEVRIHGSRVWRVGGQDPRGMVNGQHQPEGKKHMLFSTVNTFPTKLLTTAQRLFVKSRLIMLMA